MGVLNVTEDSFSDGGNFIELEASVDRVKQIYQEGAMILDIGAESSRPGSSPVSSDVQIERILPVFQEINQLNLDGLSISVDTTLSKVASLALHQGASIVNDITAGQGDPDMLPMVADTGASIILMHMQGDPVNMQAAPHYDDVVREVTEFLSERIEAALALGISERKIAIDPGIGFGKTLRHNLELLDGLADIASLGPPVVIGASRKRFLGTICETSSPSNLVGATCATTILGLNAGAKIFRVHDVAQNYQALRVWQSLINH
ncbi:MAG: dihydropteroate synthase [Gammaproteobacteria bacterium]